MYSMGRGSVLVWCKSIHFSQKCHRFRFKWLVLPFDFTFALPLTCVQSHFLIKFEASVALRFRVNRRYWTNGRTYTHRQTDGHSATLNVAYYMAHPVVHLLVKETNSKMWRSWGSSASMWACTPWNIAIAHHFCWSLGSIRYPATLNFASRQMQCTSNVIN